MLVSPPVPCGWPPADLSRFPVPPIASCAVLPQPILPRSRPHVHPPNRERFQPPCVSRLPVLYKHPKFPVQECCPGFLSAAVVLAVQIGRRGPAGRRTRL